MQVLYSMSPMLTTRFMRSQAIHLRVKALHFLYIYNSAKSNILITLLIRIAHLRFKGNGINFASTTNTFEVPNISTIPFRTGFR